jgi:hypothetical protein
LQYETLKNLPQDESFKKLPLRNHELPQYWHVHVPLVHTDCMNLATKNQPSPKSGVPRVCVPISVCMHACMYVPTYKTKAVTFIEAAA